MPQPRQPWVLCERVRHRLDAEPNDHDRVPWCRGPILSQRVRGEARALPHLAVQRLELPDRQQAGPEKGPGMNLSVARMDQHRGRIKYAERKRGTAAIYVAWKGP